MPFVDDQATEGVRDSIHYPGVQRLNRGSGDAFHVEDAGADAADVDREARAETVREVCRKIDLSAHGERGQAKAADDGGNHLALPATGRPDGPAVGMRDQRIDGARLVVEELHAASELLALERRSCVDDLDASSARTRRPDVATDDGVAHELGVFDQE